MDKTIRLTKKLSIQLFFIFLSITLCFQLQLFIGMSPIMASAIIGLIGSFLAPQRYKTLVYMSSFIAMSSFFSKNSILELILVSIIALLVFRLMDNRFKGHGGKLGLIAFISSSIFFLSRLSFDTFSH